MLRRIWRDQRGFVNTTDLILLTTLLALGAVVGLASLRNQVVQEFDDLGKAAAALNQSYEFEGRNNIQQQAYFLSVGIDPSDWLGDSNVSGSDYTDNPNADGNVGFLPPTPENATPGED